MIIPEIGDWVKVRDHDFGPGKTEDVKIGDNTFRATFLTGEPDQIGPGGSTDHEDWLPLHDIEEIITDPDEIQRLEGELEGKADWYKGEE